MASRNAAKPNIIVILTDDQGPWALGCAGNDEILTPNLDRMAQRGMRFENYFCTSPVCSPARASLLTGRIPSQHGVHDWIREGNDGADGQEYLHDSVGYTEVLAAAGYRCGLSGKWHLGRSDIPQKGFEHWYSHQKGSGHYFGAPMYRNGRLVYEKEYITDLITDDAVEFMTNCMDDDRPFYSSVHYTAPHSPWTEGEHPDALTGLYSDCDFHTCPQGPPHPEAASRFTPDDARICLIGYFAAVSGVDRGVGRILDYLEDAGILESTLVFYVSDNGFNCGHHGIWGKGNGTLTLNMYDTSVKVPALALQPGRIPAGAVNRSLLSGYDLFPTIVEHAGLTPAPEYGEYLRTLPGRSFSPLLQGSREAARDRIVVYDEYGPTRMVRTREWKYVHRYPYGPHELYHLEQDPSEETNRIADPGHRKKVNELGAMLEEWFLEYVDPERDGARLPVRGNGQLRPCGLQSRGLPVFDQDRTVSTDPRYDPGMLKDPDAPGVTDRS
jgi:choline-sulfatase